MVQKRGREQFKKVKWILVLLEKYYRLYPLKSRKKKFEKKRFKKGKWGLAVRYALLKSIANSVGENVSIHQGCYILNAEKLSIGNNVSIHPMCYLEALGGITIGNDVSIAHGTTILSTSHNFSRTDIPMKDQGITAKKTIIKDNVWLGAKVTVLAGLTIESGCVIGAGAVLTRDTEKDTVYVGVPANKIKGRCE